MAPEVVKGEIYDGKLSDIWSCGVVLYVMLFGRYPFDPPPPAPGEVPRHAPYKANAMMIRITTMQWYIPDNIPISPACRDLLNSMIVFEPSQRLSMARIQEHPWFVENLPPPAKTMNQRCIENDDLTGASSLIQLSASSALDSSQRRSPSVSFVLLLLTCSCSEYRRSERGQHQGCPQGGGPRGTGRS